jgi:hypothetical protein
MFPMTTGTCTLAKGTSPMGNGGDTMGEEGMGKCVGNAMNMVENSAAEVSTEDTVTDGNEAVALS